MATPWRGEIVTVDLDSTLADTGHRHHMIDRENGTDWNTYSLACVADSLIEATAATVRVFDEAGFEIHYLTGRTEAARDVTLEWLEKHDLPIDGLWMDDSPDANWSGGSSHGEYKLHRVRDIEKATGQRVVLHIDDWAEVKVVLEANGYLCLCVRTPQEVLELAGVGPENLR